MKLYSGPLSLFTAKVRIALAEKALDYERIEVGWSIADRYLPHHPDVVADRFGQRPNLRNLFEVLERDRGVRLGGSSFDDFTRQPRRGNH